MGFPETGKTLERRKAVSVASQTQKKQEAQDGTEVTPRGRT